MKQTYYFLRSAPYDYILPGRTLYQSFDDVARRKSDPPLRKNANVLFLEQIPHISAKQYLVLYAPSKRSKQTAEFFEKATMREEPLLAEIEYSMQQVIDEELFYDSTGKPDIMRARQSFVDSFIHNTLEEPYREVIGRIEKLLDQLKQEQYSTIMLISHGFFLKVIESYIRDKGIVDDPIQLKFYFTGETETFHFCEGFIAEQQNRHVRILSYVRNKI